ACSENKDEEKSSSNSSTTISSVKKESTIKEKHTSSSNIDNTNITRFQEYLQTNPQDFENFVDQYYSISPTTDQSKVFSQLIKGKTFTFTGTVIEPMGRRVAVIADNKFSNETWTDSISSSPLASYVIFVKDLNNTKAFKTGDKVKFTGIMSSAGANLNSVHAQWDMVNGTMEKYED
ncbi:DUF3221 domain-containing protein, partial [Enterococcus faecalis]|nr:DUF3221 domain-containing protein [Enterococcus faecalis]